MNESGNSIAHFLCFGASAAVLNRQKILQVTIEQSFGTGLTAEEWYEALLQIYLFAGFPAAIESLSTLSAVVRNRGIDFVPSVPEEYNASEFMRRGEELCKKIYTSAYGKMRERIGGITPDMDLWMIVEGYGKTLSRSGLSVQNRELVIVSVLAVLGWENQLVSHIRGALNVGVNIEECRSVIEQLTMLDVPEAVELGRNSLEKAVKMLRKSV